MRIAIASFIDIILSDPMIQLESVSQTQTIASGEYVREFRLQRRDRGVNSPSERNQYDSDKLH